MVGHLNVLLLANILTLTFEYGQGLKCYHQRAIKVDGVTEDSVLNFALKGLFDTDDQPETEHKCHKSEAYCAKMSCDLGNGVYAGAKSCAENDNIQLVPEAECNQSDLSMDRAKDCNVTRLMAKVCRIKYCSTDLCNAGGTAASSAGAFSSSFGAIVSAALLGILWHSFAAGTRI